MTLRWIRFALALGSLGGCTTATIGGVDDGATDDSSDIAVDASVCDLPNGASGSPCADAGATMCCSFGSGFVCNDGIWRAATDLCTPFADVQPIDAHRPDTSLGTDCGVPPTGTFACGPITCPRSSLCATDSNDAGVPYRCVPLDLLCPPYSCDQVYRLACAHCTQSPDGDLSAICPTN